MRYLILPLTYGLCLHYMLEASRMVALNQLSKADSHLIWLLALAAALAITVGRLLGYLDDHWFGGRIPPEKGCD